MKVSNDKARYAKKIAVYAKAVEKVGFNRVEAKIGSYAAGKFELAQDAFKRQQADYIVSDFLADAQSTINDDDYDICDVLKSL
ncbi:hypothetical protein D3C85_693540 [compost metagenome]